MKPKGILLAWFLLLSCWAVLAVLNFFASVLIAIVPDSRTSPVLILGTLLLAIVTITTAVGVRRVTRRAARMTRAFGVFSSLALLLMVLGTVNAGPGGRVAFQALVIGCLAMGAMTWWIARRIDRAVEVAL